MSDKEAAVLGCRQGLPRTNHFRHIDFGFCIDEIRQIRKLQYAEYLSPNKEFNRVFNETCLGKMEKSDLDLSTAGGVSPLEWC